MIQLMRADKCKITINRITNGKMKCKKKEFRVALLIENPPQIHNTNISNIWDCR